MFLYLEAEVNVFEDCIPKSPGKKKEAMMPFPLHFSRPAGTKTEERLAYLCEPQVNFSLNISAFG